MGNFVEGEFGYVKSRRKSTTGTTTETTDHTTKNKNIREAKQGNVPNFPGDFELLKLELISPNREGTINLKTNWSDFNIYEDMFSNCLTGSITMTDGVGFMESLPIIGEETIRIHVRTRGFKRERSGEKNVGPFGGSENDGIIDLSFRVYKIDNVIKMNEGLTMFTLHLISEEYLLNLKTKIRKSWDKPIRISTMVKELYQQFFMRGRPLAKKIFIEPTLNLTNLIIPNYAPFKAFNFLSKRAISSGQHAVGSNFVFYETVKGFFFISLETLMSGGGTGYTAGEGSSDAPNEGAGFIYTKPEQPVKEVYTVQPKTMNKFGDDNKNVALELVSVDSYKFTSNFDVVENLRNGMYANRLLTHDIVRMKWDTLDFNYVNPENLDKKIKVLPDTTGATEVLEFAAQAKDAKNFFDTFTHLGEGQLCSVDQDALGSPEGHTIFFPTNFAHEERFKQDLGSQGVKGTVKGDLNIISNKVEQWMQSRLVQEQEQQNIKLNIRAPGLSTRSIGDLIEFKLPTTDLDDRGTEVASTGHTYLSGYYLITKLRHHFTSEKYEIDFEAIKDALHTSVGAGTSAANDPRAAVSEK